MKRSSLVTILIFLILSLILTWAPWLNEQEIHDLVFQEKAHKDGTFGLVIYPNGTIQHELICDYKYHFPLLVGGLQVAKEAISNFLGSDTFIKFLE
ncbi:MAG: hypothetical protein QW051_02440 [Candidatus Aenigmatarchaeota archaeon]